MESAIRNHTKPGPMMKAQTNNRIPVGQNVPSYCNLCKFHWYHWWTNLAVTQIMTPCMTKSKVSTVTFWKSACHPTPTSQNHVQPGRSSAWGFTKIYKNNGQREPMNSKWIAVENEWNECCWSTRSTTPATAQRQGPPGHPALTEALPSRLRRLRGLSGATPSSCIRRFHRLHRLHLTFQKDFLQGPHGRASKTWMVNVLLLVNVLNQNL